MGYLSYLSCYFDDLLFNDAIKLEICVTGAYVYSLTWYHKDVVYREF